MVTEDRGHNLSGIDSQDIDEPVYRDKRGGEDKKNLFQSENQQDDDKIKGSGYPVR